jgi:hypothetical protein
MAKAKKQPRGGTKGSANPLLSPPNKRRKANSNSGASAEQDGLLFYGELYLGLISNLYRWRRRPIYGAHTTKSGQQNGGEHP